MELSILDIKPTSVIIKLFCDYLILFNGFSDI